MKQESCVFLNENEKLEKVICIFSLQCTCFIPPTWGGGWGGSSESKICRKFDQRTSYHVKIGTYIPDIQVRPHPCILSRTLPIVFKNPVNINCCIFHCHLSVTHKLITDSFTAFLYPCFQLVCSYSEIIFIILSLNVTDYHVTIFFVMQENKVTVRFLLVKDCNRLVTIFPLLELIAWH